MNKKSRKLEIEEEIKELKDKIWELKKEMRGLKGFAIMGCENTKI